MIPTPETVAPIVAPKTDDVPPTRRAFVRVSRAALNLDAVTMMLGLVGTIERIELDPTATTPGTWRVWITNPAWPPGPEDEGKLIVQEVRSKDGTTGTLSVTIKLPT